MIQTGSSLDEFVSISEQLIVGGGGGRFERGQPVDVVRSY
jgi:hypothetical protein